jgi:hypothetical protein
MCEIKETEQKRKFNKEWKNYIGGFYDDYSYLDEYSAGSMTDFTTEAFLIGCDVSGKIKESDTHKVKRYCKDK